MIGLKMMATCFFVTQASEVFLRICVACLYAASVLTGSGSHNEPGQAASCVLIETKPR